MFKVCQYICLWLSHQERVYSPIVITTYAQCLSMYLFMALPSRKGLQSDCNFHICSIFVNVCVYCSPIQEMIYSPIVITTYAQCMSMYLFMVLPSRKGLQSDCNFHICSMYVNVCVYCSPIQEMIYSQIVITTYAQCMSMYLFMVLPSRKGFQSDCYYHICSMFVYVSVYNSPIKKGCTV